MSVNVESWNGATVAPDPITRPPADIRFRPGPGGEITAEWAAYMLNLWWAARDKKLAFSEAAKRATVHFMVGEDEP